MYDTQKRVELVKKQILEKLSRQNRCEICRQIALCLALFAFLVGAVREAIGQSHILTAQGMYASVLLHEDVGGYVLVGVVSFAAAVIFTVMRMKFREKDICTQNAQKENSVRNWEGKK